jgi:hypothetical protein
MMFLMVDNIHIEIKIKKRKEVKGETGKNTKYK